MKSKSIIILILMFLWVALVSVSDILAETFPVVFWAEKNYEFKEIPEGTPVVHDFILKNTGNAPLHIEKVLTG